MNTSNIINSIGLCIDIIGAIIVFLNSPEKTYTTYLYNKEELERLNLKAKRIKKRSQIGVILLGLGFLFQLVSNFLH